MAELFKVVVAGSRELTDYALVCEKLDNLLRNKATVEIVHGGCRGADLLGKRYAAERGYACREVEADWDTHGKNAGPIRNKEMSLYADACVVFKPTNIESYGSKDMIRQAERAGIPIRVVNYLQEVVPKRMYSRAVT
ncbi:MAG: DUF2493 domain-containing protein [Cytophagaceae bacterium]|nr:MAG: DUF2493 domain-containing protein [Cytophagaceae bacterium]